ncbi:putative ABC transport system permease protein [Spirosomataceae bacterium TFI 002]|nr:putative ABC transport system permease protein [Spirosomataceae bacterium TFI 002]
MMWLKIIWAKVMYKKLNSFLCVLLMAFGISIIALLLSLEKQMDGAFTKNIRGIDMVVGAKGSPLQLILSSVFQIDNPTGNVPLAEVNALKTNSQVKKVIPISMGDNYKGFRIIGTQNSYIEHFEGKIKSGLSFQKPLEVVIGASVANDLGLKIGAEFESTHGLDAAGEAHEDHDHFTVVGILDANGSPLDRLIITSLQSVWEVHHQDLDKPENLAVTAALVKFRSPMGLMTIPRNINENTSMQAALPSIEIDRLLQLFGSGLSLAKYLAFLIILISAVSVFISIYNTIKEGKGEIALMISLGANRWQLFTQFVGQGLVLGFLGYILGIFISKFMLFVASVFLKEKLILAVGWLNLSNSEIYLLFLALLISIFAAALPAIKVYGLNLSKTLATE